MFGERNGTFEGVDTVKPVIRFSREKFVIDNFQAAQTSTEDEAYCPPTPVPKKSILKDPSTSSEKNKQVINYCINSWCKPDLKNLSDMTYMDMTYEKKMKCK